MNVLGIMSGTSLDGVDYAICRIGNGRIRLVKTWHAKFPAALRSRLRDCASNRSTSHEVGQLHHDLGRFYAHGTGNLTRAKIGLVGLHGQTVFHQPKGPASATFQLGEAAHLRHRLDVPVVCNFRAADLAAGGHGAPLATAFHLKAFARRGYLVAVQNLGGIGNVTVMDWRARGSEPRVLSFDTGPANLLVDLAVHRFTQGGQYYDAGGALAFGGRADLALIRRWMKQSFFSLPPPKSTGREMFGEAFVASAIRDMKRRGCSPADIVATLSEFTVRTILAAYERFLPAMPERVILAGGGARNGFFVRRLREELQRRSAGIEMLRSADYGWPECAVEPAAFAWLAYLRWRRIPGNLPRTTGATRAVLLGQLLE